jgi:hypothetical protein
LLADLQNLPVTRLSIKLAHAQLLAYLGLQHLQQVLVTVIRDADALFIQPVRSAEEQ